MPRWRPVHNQKNESRCESHHGALFSLRGAFYLNTAPWRQAPWWPSLRSFVSGNEQHSTEASSVVARDAIGVLFSARNHSCTHLNLTRNLLSPLRLFPHIGGRADCLFCPSFDGIRNRKIDEKRDQRLRVGLRENAARCPFLHWNYQG